VIQGTGWLGAAPGDIGGVPYGVDKKVVVGEVGPV
jgi:hypothetical protein